MSVDDMLENYSISVMNYKYYTMSPDSFDRELRRKYYLRKKLLIDRARNLERPFAHRRTPEESRRHTWCLGGKPDEEQFWNALYSSNVGTQTPSSSPTRFLDLDLYTLRRLRRRIQLGDRLLSLSLPAVDFHCPPEAQDGPSPPSPIPGPSNLQKVRRRAALGHVKWGFEELIFERPIKQAPEEKFDCSKFYADNNLYSSEHLARANEQSNEPSSPRTPSPMERMNTIDEQERKIIIEFCYLLEKAKQLFNALRALPQYGHKQWHSYFGRTFDVYTKLWKYQQQHRAILDSKYGLKRWQIGEIASKIGQLYYHFYLRTSETAYLYEAFSFYSAIRGRSYYTKASREDRCELMVKKLRYYARFIVVCLLLKKVKFVRDLIKELDKLIVDYGNTYDPDDQLEWVIVVDEVRAFVQAEQVITVQNADGLPIVLSQRLTSLNTPPVERTSQMTLSLQEVVIVGSSNQVKFSELTMDMFRILQTLEREPSETNVRHGDSPPRMRYIPTPNSRYNPDSRSVNPHKYLLFKPSPTQVLVYLASGCHDLPPNGALLLYISADGHTLAQKPSDEAGYELGGLITTSRSDIYRDANREQEPKPGPSTSKYKESRCLYPGDLVPFTRRPLFMIIESDKSYIFQQIPRHFEQPLIIMMSPIELPEQFQDRRREGNLFTLFLHCPLSAICYLTDVINFTLPHWERALNIIDRFMAEAFVVLSRCRIDPAFVAFIGDDFCRLLILRYIFCEVTIRRHHAFRMRNHHPKLLPALPDDIFENPALNYIVLELAGHLQVTGLFHEQVLPPPTRE